MAQKVIAFGKVGLYRSGSTDRQCQSQSRKLKREWTTSQWKGGEDYSIFEMGIFKPFQDLVREPSAEKDRVHDGTRYRILSLKCGVSCGGTARRAVPGN